MWIWLMVRIWAIVHESEYRWFAFKNALIFITVLAAILIITTTIAR